MCVILRENLYGMLSEGEFMWYTVLSEGECSLYLVRENACVEGQKKEKLISWNFIFRRRWTIQ